ncbi:hypothetical protein GOC91_14890 [Sinorhizobium medicae]|uniref:Uncharacterized protein n=1 Tax=Sinorhizobium medicae (strain WSM419) TaxID=366394 RepID=A6UL48_SINMW|nr:hypothetical protein Smed_5643 [Sinorhizobium medicae WSM419]MDX0437836.1 hypothetical protein [Sinorhizobium medicae]MDX0456064.1 hypothetical protein [Sinorhizobium medicae]MDX0481343.1 hypothetical protein [Sinorhizobium medicae]MDX0505733.1 hypothetical protein [Sinorhizobium medicae]
MPWPGDGQGFIYAPSGAEIELPDIVAEKKIGLPGHPARMQVNLS